jgi:hypothetical protein
MNTQEIKQAVREGKRVCLKNYNYQVKMHNYNNGGEQWLITCLTNNYSIGLTWQDEVTLNGKEEDFYID